MSNSVFNFASGNTKTMIAYLFGLLVFLPSVLANVDQFVLQKDCAKECWSSGRTTVWSNCNGESVEDLTSCWCGTALQKASEDYLTSCVTSSCGGSAADIKLAVGLYDGYCTAKGFRAAAVSSSSTTSSSSSYSASASSTSATVVASTYTAEPTASANSTIFAPTAYSSTTAPSATVAPAAPTQLQSSGAQSSLGSTFFGLTFVVLFGLVSFFFQDFERKLMKADEHLNVHLHEIMH